MKLAALYLGAVIATVRRDAEIFFSYRTRVLSQTLAVLLTLSIFFYVAKLVRPDAAGTGRDYFSFAVVGIVTLSVLSAALSSAQVVRLELMQGNFERVLISPLGPVWGVISVAAFPVLWEALFAGVMLTAASLLYGFPIIVAHIPEAVAAGLLGAAGLAAIGLIFVAALLAVKSALGATWVIAGLSLVGGAYFPIRLFPGWIRWTSQVQPFTPTVDLLRHTLLGTRPVEPVWLEVVKLIGFSIVLGPIAFATLWWSVNVSRRRGTIMEY